MKNIQKTEWKTHIEDHLHGLKETAKPSRELDVSVHNSLQMVCMKL